MSLISDTEPDDGHGSRMGLKDATLYYTLPIRRLLNDEVQVGRQVRPPNPATKLQDNSVHKATCSPAHHKTNSPFQAQNWRIQKSRLLLLPMELKDMVIGHVRSRRDLSILSQTCYDLREATLPFLFRVVEISTSRGLNSLRTAFELGNPGRLADMVRTFKLRATFDYPLNKGNRVCSNTTQSADCVVLGLIYAATKLTRIEIHYQLDQLKPIGRYNAYSIKGDALSNALTSAQATLKHLKLSYEAFIGSGIMRPAVRGFCSLRQLQCLQTVDIPLFLLLGWRPIGAPALADVLPSSLKMLRFGDDEWVDMLEWDESLIMEKFVEYFGDQRWKNTTPNLKSVVLSLWAYDDVNDDCPDREWKPNGGESSFKRLCSENGLLCEVIRNNWAWKKWNHLTGSN